MATTPAQGHMAQLAIGGTKFEFLSCSLGLKQTHVISNGIRGYRSRNKERARIGREAVSGTIVLNPSVSEIDILLPYVLGGATAGGITKVADALQTFTVIHDVVTKVLTFTVCSVNRCTIRGSSGGPLTWTLDIEGEAESTGNAGSFSASAINTENFFVMSDCTLTLQSAAREMNEFELVIDNVLDSERYMNATSRAEIAPQDRVVTLSAGIPYTTDNIALYDQAIAGASGTLVMADGTTTYTIALANVKAEAESPNTTGKTEIFLPLRMNCLKTGIVAGTTDEIMFTKT